MHISGASMKLAKSLLNFSAVSRDKFEMLFRSWPTGTVRCADDQNVGSHQVA